MWTININAPGKATKSQIKRLYTREVFYATSKSTAVFGSFSMQYKRIIQHALSAYLDLVVLSLLESTIQAQLHPKQKQQLLVSPPLQSAAGVVWCSWVIARAARGEINFYYQQLQKLQTQPLTDSPLSHSPQSHNKPGPLPSETIIIPQTVINSPTETLNVPRHKTKLKVGR